MKPSIHHYVLSLSDQMSRLYEGFRDHLIDIQNSHFPFESSLDALSPTNPASKDTQLRAFLHQTDQHFDQYYQQDPLRLVVVGEKNQLTIFITLTTHRDVIIGTVAGNYTATSTNDLGKIVWPVVKESIADANQNALRDLATAARTKQIVSGIEAVGQSVETETGSTLYVEEDYHVRGSLYKTDHAVMISKHVNLREVLDDVVDVIIEKVLEMGGNVIFLNNGALINLERIALILGNMTKSKPRH